MQQQAFNPWSAMQPQQPSPDDDLATKLNAYLANNGGGQPMTPAPVMQEAQQLQQTAAPAAAPLPTVPRETGVSSTATSKTTSKQLGQGLDTALKQLNDRELQSLRDQGLTVDSLKKQLVDLQGKELPMDMTGFAALTDAWTGSKFAQSYRPEETAKDRQASIEKLQGAILHGGQDLSANEINLLKDQLGNAFHMEGLSDKRTQDAEKNKIEWAKIAAMRDKAAKAGEGFTPGQKAVDQRFATTYNEYVNAGGHAAAEKSLDQVQSAAQNLKEHPEYTGAKYGSTPGFLKAWTQPEALANEETVKDVVGSSLRTILGSQFTKEEGERILAQSYNPKLSGEENSRRLDRIQKQLVGMAASKKAAVDYYETNGSLKGFKGNLPSISDVLDNADSKVSRDEMIKRIKAAKGEK